MRATGWNPPKEADYARLKCAGPRAASILDNVTPADSADATALIQIVDQRNLGSCVANAVGQIIRAEQLRCGAPAGYPFPSRMWLYTLALAADGMQGQDVGTNICTAIDRAAQFGFCPEDRWPYEIPFFGDDPPLDAHRYASDQRTKKALSYHEITETGNARIEAMRKALTAGKPVAFGSPVTKAFCSESPSGTVMRPSPSEPIGGNHAQVAACYWVNPATGRLEFKVANSWSEDWGEAGWSWWDWEYFTWRETCDLWIAGEVPLYSEAP